MIPTLKKLALGAMPGPLRRALIRTRLRLLPETVRYRGVLLPARHLRYGEPSFQTDEAFLQSAREETRRLAQLAGLNRTSRVLDVGCGTGRFLIGLLEELGGVAAYSGVDVDPAPIAWCRRHLAARQEGLRFEVVDVRSDRYRPDAPPLDASFRFPFPPASFDLIYVYSVFCHFIAEELTTYLRAFRPLLAPGGRVFLTAYLEDGVPAVTVNPEGYLQAWTQPRHCVRYERAYFFDLVAGCGFRVDHYDHRSEYDGESALILTPGA